MHTVDQTKVNMEVGVAYATPATVVDLAKAEADFAAGMAQIARGEDEVEAGQIACGAALNYGRGEFAGDKEFGIWCSSNLEEDTDVHPADLSAWMWAAGFPAALADMKAAHPRVRTLRGWHEKWKDAKRAAEATRTIPPPPTGAGAATETVERKVETSTSSGGAGGTKSTARAATSKPDAAATDGDARRIFYATDPARAQRIGAMVVDEGMTHDAVCEAMGVSAIIVRQAAAYYWGRKEREGEMPIDYATIPGSAREKLDAAVARKAKELEWTFEARVQEAATKRMGDYMLPAWYKMIDDAKAILAARRKGALSVSDFKLIKKCLHRDGNISPEDMDRALDTFLKLELVLTPYKDQAGVDALPRTLEEFAKVRRKPSAGKEAAA